MIACMVEWGTQVLVSMSISKWLYSTLDLLSCCSGTSVTTVIGIYADDTILYSSLVFFEKVESAGKLKLDLCSIVEWGCDIQCH